MKTLVVFYSYTGKTKALAEKKASEEGADIEEVKELKKRSVISAYTVGALRAMGRKKAAIHPPKANLSGYERIIIMAPVWAGHPAPAFNGIVEALPKGEGKKIELIMVSGGGSSKGSREKTKELITARGYEVLSYTDIKA